MHLQQKRFTNVDEHFEFINLILQGHLVFTKLYPILRSELRIPFCLCHHTRVSVPTAACE